MKEYTNARQLECQHLTPDGEEIPCPGYCPKLIAISVGDDKQLGPSQRHAMHWSDSELRNLIREIDKGHFDPPGLPPRKSAFFDPLTSTLINTLQTNPIHALGILLYLGQPTSIAFTANPPTLALQDPEGSWIHIHLNTTTMPETPADLDDGENFQSPDNEWLDNASSWAEDEEQTPAELPNPVTYHDTPPTGAQLLWTQPQGDQP